MNYGCPCVHPPGCSPRLGCVSECWFRYPLFHLFLVSVNLHIRHQVRPDVLLDWNFVDQVL